MEVSDSAMTDAKLGEIQKLLNRNDRAEIADDTREAKFRRRRKLAELFMAKGL
jgi:hypothetical protein